MSEVISLRRARQERDGLLPKIVHAGIWQARPVRHKQSLWWGIVLYAIETGARTQLVVSTGGVNRVVAVEDVEEMLDRGTAS